MKRMKNTIYVAFGIVSLSLLILLNLGGNTANASNSNIISYESEMSNGQTIEMIYVESTQKLGIVVKDKEGKNITGYILKDVSDTLGEHNLSLSKKYGKGGYLGKTFKIDSINDDSAVIVIANQQKPIQMKVATESTNELQALPGCYWVCDGAVEFDWWKCFKCCLLSPGC